MTWKDSALHVGQNIQQEPGKERHVDINYYDSWTVLKERCVRNKPPQSSMLKIGVTAG